MNANDMKRIMTESYQNLIDPKVRKRIEDAAKVAASNGRNSTTILIGESHNADAMVTSLRNDGFCAMYEYVRDCVDGLHTNFTKYIISW